MCVLALIRVRSIQCARAYETERAEIRPTYVRDTSEIRETPMARFARNGVICFRNEGVVHMPQDLLRDLSQRLPQHAVTSSVLPEAQQARLYSTVQSLYCLI